MSFIRIGFVEKRGHVLLHYQCLTSENRVMNSNQKAALCTSVDIRHRPTGTYFPLTVPFEESASTERSVGTKGKVLTSYTVITASLFWNLRLR